MRIFLSIDCHWLCQLTFQAVGCSQVSQDKQEWHIILTCWLIKIQSAATPTVLLCCVISHCWCTLFAKTWRLKNYYYFFFVEFRHKQIFFNIWFVYDFYWDVAHADIKLVLEDKINCYFQKIDISWLNVFRVHGLSKVYVLIMSCMQYQFLSQEV